MKASLKGALQISTLFAVVLATAIGVHKRDDLQESRDVKALIAKYDDLGNSNLLAAYVGNVTISNAIRAGKVGSAQCESDLRASAQYGLLKACLADRTCAAGIIEMVRTEAPELLTDSPTPFKQYKAGEVCAPNGEHRAG